MLDAHVRPLIAPALDAAAARLSRRGVSANALTAVGLLFGLGACVAAALAAWWAALGLWLANRALDGLDGPLARRTRSSDRGGLLDIVADFTVYSGFVLGVAIARPPARLACVALLVSYYVSGTVFLAFSSIAERRRLRIGDERSLRFVGGLAEGTETIVVYILFCLLPGAAETIAWAFAAVVAVTALQRVLGAVRALDDDPHVSEDPPRSAPATAAAGSRAAPDR